MIENSIKSSNQAKQPGKQPKQAKQSKQPKQPTRQLIEETFQKLLKEKPLSEIDIKSLTTAAGINRNTFYYHYKNIPDLIESITKKYVDQTLESHPPTYDSFEDCLIVAIDFARANKDSIYHIYNSASRSIFERYLWKICDYAVTACIDSFPDHTALVPPEEREILIAMLKYECFGFVMDWIRNGMPDTVTAKVKLLSASIKSQTKHLPRETTF